MSSAKFPAPLQPIIQQGFLARRFQTGLKATIGFRAIADRQVFPGRFGQTITETRRGLLVPVESPTPASANTGLDSGMAQFDRWARRLCPSACRSAPH